MNVTLVYRGRYLVRQALELETLAPVIRRAGHEVSLAFDPGVLGVTDNVLQVPAVARRLSSPGLLARKILARKPSVLLFSVLPATFGFLNDTARLVREKSPAPIVFMGLFPSLAARAVLKRGAADLVIEGEAEPAVPGLLDMIARAGLPDAEALSAIPNLVFRRGEDLVRTEKAPPVDLDSLPLPDKDLFAPLVSQRTSYAAMVSRGCPFSCSFCEETCMKALYGPGWFRRKGVDAVMAELEAGKARYGFRELIFKDSYLSGDEAWLADLMARFRSGIGVPFKCFATILGFTEKTARLLKEGGCYGVEFGLQTWNEDIRLNVLNRRESDQEARRVFGYCSAAGLAYDVDHMFGLPGETEADHLEGLFAYKGLPGLNRVKVHHLVYLPGAPIALKAPESNLAARLGEGVAADFYDPAFAPAEASRARLMGWAALYKLLPLIPEPLLRRLARRPQAFGRIPKILMAALQGLAAAKTGDLRFAVYLRDYPRLVLRALIGRLTNG